MRESIRAARGPRDAGTSGGDDKHRRCGTCGRVQHPFLFAFADRKRGTRDYTCCLPCRSHALNVRDGWA